MNKGEGVDMSKVSCSQCGETDKKAIMVDENHVVHCATCGASISMNDSSEMKNTDASKGDVTMTDVLEVVNANIEFSKKHQDLLNTNYDDSDLPF